MRCGRTGISTVFNRRDAEAQRQILTASIAAKNVKSAKQNFIMVFNLRIFASFAAENYFFSEPPRLCGNHLPQYQLQAYQQCHGLKRAFDHLIALDDGQVCTEVAADRGAQQ